MKRILATLATVSGVCFVAWLGGYNFDHRGADAVFVAIFACYLGGIVCFVPQWPK